MKTYQDFHVTLLKFANEYIAKLETPQNRKEMAEALHNQLWNLDGLRQIESKLTPEDKFFSLVFRVSTKYQNHIFAFKILKFIFDAFHMVIQKFQKVDILNITSQIILRKFIFLKIDWYHI